MDIRGCFERSPNIDHHLLPYVHLRYICVHPRLIASS